MSFLNVNPFDRVQVFIDGQNVYGTMKSLGGQRKLDYKKFLNLLVSNTRLIRANYYTTVRENANDQFFGVLDFLENNGYTINTKEIREHVDDAGFVRIRGTMIGEMTAGMVLAAAGQTDHIILMSGDGEMTAAVEACKRLDTRVTVISHDNVLSDDLRAACDDFFPITDLPKEAWL